MSKDHKNSSSGDESGDNMTMNISTEEFSQLQNQIMGLKSEKYDLQQREKNQANELKRLKQSLVTLRQDYVKSQNIIKQSKAAQNVVDMTDEIEQLRKMIEMMNVEHREQNEALRKNMHHVYESKVQLEKQMQEQKKENERLEKKIVEMMKKEIESSSSEQSSLISSPRPLILSDIEASVAQALKEVDIDMDALISKKHVEESAMEDVEATRSISEEEGGGGEEERVAITETKQDETKELSAANITDNNDTRELPTTTTTSSSSLQAQTILDQVIKSLRQTLPVLLHQSSQGMILPTSTMGAERKGEENQLATLGETTESFHDESRSSNTSNSPVMSPDVDLLNRVTNLENELEQNRKQFETQKDNLEQQLEIWREKNNMKQEKQHAMNEHISELQDNIDDLKETLEKSRGEITALTSQLEQKEKSQKSFSAKWKEMEKSQTALTREKEDLSKKISNMQKMINNTNKKLKEVSSVRENLKRDLADAQKKLTQVEPLVEKGKMMDRTVKDLEEECEKSKSLREEILMLRTEKDDLSEEIANKDMRIKNTQTSVSQLRDQIQSLNAQLDCLSKEKDNVVERARNYVTEMSTRDQSLTSEVKTLRDVVDRQTTTIEHLERETVHNFVRLSMAQVSLRIVTKEHRTMIVEMEQLHSDHADNVNRLREINTRNDQLERKVKDQEVDIALKLKQSKALIRELRSQVQKERKKSSKETLSSSSSSLSSSSLSSSSSTANMSAINPVAGPSSTLMRTSNSIGNLQRRSSGLSDISLASFGAMNNTSVINGNSSMHQRTASSSSRKSIDSTTSDVHSTYYPNVNDDQLIKENNILLRRIADLQTTKWHLEEQSRILKDEMARSRLELDKKGEIIEYYLHREKLGRLAPEQERHRNNMAQKSERSFMASLFSSGSSSSSNSNRNSSSGNGSPISGGGIGGGKNLSNEAYGKMQQVMEETLMLNIELQGNMKIMGEDIARLQNENEQLRSRLFALKQNS